MLIKFLFLLIFFNFKSFQKKIPIIRWGQKSYLLNINVMIPLIDKEDVKFDKQNIYIHATDKNGEEYEINLDLLRSIDISKCKYNVLELGLKLIVYKEKKEPCWKHLTKQKKKENFIRDKALGDLNDCELEKINWFNNYKFYKRKLLPKQPTNTSADGIESIIENLKRAHPSFSIHEY